MSDKHILYCKMAEDKRQRGRERLVWLVVGVLWVCVAVLLMVTG